MRDETRARAKVPNEIAVPCERTEESVVVPSHALVASSLPPNQILRRARVSNWVAGSGRVFCNAWSLGHPLR